jgi:hypothetical protein
MTNGTLTVARQPLSTVELRQRQEAAERFIEQSGDGQAIRALGPLRRSQDTWFDRLKAAAASQTTLKIALGVFLGVIAAEAALAALRSDTVQSLINEIDSLLSPEMDRVSHPALEMDGLESATQATQSGATLAHEPLADAINVTGHSSFVDDAISSVSDALAAPQNDALDLDLGSVIDDLLG